MSHELRLWITPDRTRFFLVPSDAEIPDGDIEVRSLNATSAKLDAAALAEHEVDIDRASAHVNAGWEGVVGRFRDRWAEWTGAEKSLDPPDLSQWLGVTPGEVLTDPEKQRQGRRTLIERAGRLVGRELDVDRIDERLEQLAGELVEGTGRLKAEGERLAERLEERRPAIEAQIEGTGERVVELGREALQRLRAIGRKPEPPEDER